MEQVTQDTEVKEEDPKVGMVVPPASALRAHGVWGWEVTGVRGSELAFRITPFPRSLLTNFLLCLIWPRVVAKMNEPSFRFFQVLVDMARINKNS